MIVPRAALAVPGDLTTLTGGYIYDRRLLRELRAMGIDVGHIALPGSFPEPDAQDMSATFELLAAVSDDCPVIIDGLAFGAMDPERVVRMRAPIVALIHHPLALESGLDPVRARQLHESERANLACAVQVIVPSPHTAALLVSDYGVPRSRVHIARPGTDRPTAPVAPVDPPLILSVGIQQPRKGHDVLLHALAMVTDLDWQARIVGAPLGKAHPEELAALRLTLGLADRVTLLGQVSQEDLGALYRAAHVFALATRFEGYGIVFDEALVHGLPIVSCKVGAVPDTVPKDAGVLVHPAEPEAFAGALRHVLSDSNRHRNLSNAALAAGRALPSWADTAAVAARALAAAVRGTGAAP
jgi:glycosyltransferase involved in cell wall biosynthesis